MTSTETPGWPRRMTKLIGEQVKRHRGERQLTAAALADITEKLGHRVDTNVIANIETGRRINMPLTDLLVLASALRVPPSLLVCPVGTDADVEILPARSDSAWRAYKAFVGDIVLIPSDESSTNYMAERMPPVIATYRRFDNAVSAYLRAGEEDSWKRLAALEGLVAAYAEMSANNWAMPRGVTARDPRQEAIELRARLEEQEPGGS